MSKETEHLETLTPSIKFYQGNETRLASLTAQANAIGSMFLRKRERLGSEDFGETVMKQSRGLSDAIAPDYKILIDGNFEGHKRRRSSVLMMKDLPNPVEEALVIEEAEQEAEEEHAKPEEKPETKKKKDNEGFDFLTPKQKRKKETKFVLKMDKEKEDFKLNEKTRGRKKKQAEENDRASVGSFIKTSEPDAQNEGEAKSTSVVDEKQRLKIKIGKVSTYWDKKSLYIPNVFRLAKLIEDDAKNLTEFQDYSKKSVLVQGQGQSHKKSTNSNVSAHIDAEELDECVTLIHRRSLNIVLDHPEDMLAFLK